LKGASYSQESRLQGKLGTKRGTGGRSIFDCDCTRRF